MAEKVGIYRWDWEKADAPPLLMGTITLNDDGTLETDNPNLQSMIDVTMARNNGDSRVSMNQIREFDNGYSWAAIPGGPPGETVQLG